MDNEQNGESIPVDFFNQPLFIGDEVAYILVSHTYGKKRMLERGVILKLGSAKATISRNNYDGRTFVEYGNIVKVPKL